MTWQTKALNGVAKIIMGQSPDSRYYNVEGVGVPFLQGSAQFGSVFPTPEVHCTAPLRVAPKGSLLMSVRAPVGDINVADTDYCIGRGLAAIVPREIDDKYLLYLLHFARPKLEQIGQGSTFGAVNSSELGGFALYLPSERDEQLAISAILAAVDQAIGQTETLISKYQHIQTGLLHDLLTRGIDEHGLLRHPSTHEFKKSPMGLVPEEWEVTTLGRVVGRSNGSIQTGPFGSQLHAHEYVAAGIPVIMPQNIRANGTIDLDGAAQITRVRADELRRHFVQGNDVIFARRGDLSRCAPIAEGTVALCGTGCLLVRISPTVLMAEWLSETYQHHRSQRQVSTRAVGSTMVNLNTGLLEDLIIAIPSINEQRGVVSAANQMAALLSNELGTLAKLRRLKSGLMYDLLCGNVSVVHLIDVAGAHRP